MKEIIYLIGSISVDEPKTYEWRLNVVKYFEKYKDQFEIINPCDNEWNVALLEKNINKDPERFEIYKSMGVRLIVPKDKTYVMESTIGLADMTQYDTNKPLIGTMFELAWYHDHPEKSVIGIYDGNPSNSVWSGHPFVQDTVKVWVKDHKEACELIKLYFRRDKHY